MTGVLTRLILSVFAFSPATGCRGSAARAPESFVYYLISYIRSYIPTGVARAGEPLRDLRPPATRDPAFGGSAAARRIVAIPHHMDKFAGWYPLGVTPRRAVLNTGGQQLLSKLISRRQVRTRHAASMV